MTTSSQRRDPRFRVSPRDSTVEFDHPGPGGRRWCPSLSQISVAGLAFVFEDEIPPLEPGERVSDAVVRVGECAIHGDLSILYGPSPDAVQSYGALFYPRTDIDQVRLMSVLAGMKAVEPD